MDDEEKVRIWVNSDATMSRGKYAAHAVHVALTAAGVHPGLPVVVLGAPRADIWKLNTVIHDAGRTELEPGTVTAGTNWTPEVVMDDAYARVWGFLEDRLEDDLHLDLNDPAQSDRFQWIVESILKLAKEESPA